MPSLRTGLALSWSRLSARQVRPLQKINATPEAVILPVDVGLSNGKVLPLIARKSSRGIQLDLADREILFGYAIDNEQKIKNSLFQKINGALAIANEIVSLDAKVPRLITVDTMGAGAEITQGKGRKGGWRSLVPLFLYTNPQYKKGWDLITLKLGQGDLQTALKRIHSATGGSVWTDVLNLYHLAAIMERLSDQDPKSLHLANIPDVILNHLSGFSSLDGRIATEMGFVRSTLCGTLEARSWNFELLSQLGIPVEMFPEVIVTGTEVGNLREEVARKVGFNGKVIAAATHDTDGAMWALRQISPPNSIFLSSGSWNIMGLPISIDRVTSDFLDKLFDRQLGIEGARGSEAVVANLLGGQLVDALLGEFTHLKGDYDQLFEGIENPEVPFAFLNIMSPRFPYDMSSYNIVGALAEYCRATNQPVPNTREAIVKTVFVGMVLKMAEAVEGFRELMKFQNREPESIEAGGGVAMNNPLMMQALADATGLPVKVHFKGLAGYGNAGLALLGARLASGEEVREALWGASSQMNFSPDSSQASLWREVYQDYLAVKSREG